MVKINCSIIASTEEFLNGELLPDSKLKWQRWNDEFCDSISPLSFPFNTNAVVEITESSTHVWILNIKTNNTTIIKPIVQRLMTDFPEHKFKFSI